MMRLFLGSVVYDAAFTDEHSDIVTNINEKACLSWPLLVPVLVGNLLQARADW